MLPSISHSVPTLEAATLTMSPFMAYLSPKARVIHTIAAERLKTRYVPERTNAWTAWVASKGDLKK